MEKLAHSKIQNEGSHKPLQTGKTLSLEMRKPFIVLRNNLNPQNRFLKAFTSLPKRETHNTAAAKTSKSSRKLTCILCVESCGWRGGGGEWVLGSGCGGELLEKRWSKFENLEKFLSLSQDSSIPKPQELRSCHSRIRTQETSHFMFSKVQNCRARVTCMCVCGCGGVAERARADNPKDYKSSANPTQTNSTIPTHITHQKKGDESYAEEFIGLRRR